VSTINMIDPMWLAVVEQMANGEYDGHFTLMRLTTGWKAVFGTPDICGENRDEIFSLATHADANEAVADAIARELLVRKGR
jgi:hypothetical protein